PTRTVAAAMGIRMSASDNATRSVRARPASFCIQPSIIAIRKRSAMDAIGAICRNDGGCNFVEGWLNGSNSPRAVVVTLTLKVPAAVGVTATEAGAAEQVAAVGAPVQVMAAVTD